MDEAVVDRFAPQAVGFPLGGRTTGKSTLLRTAFPQSLTYDFLKTILALSFGARPALLRALNHGLLPSHYRSSHPRRSLEAYVRDYLKEEVFDEGLTRNVPAFSRFFEAVGYSHGERCDHRVVDHRRPVSHVARGSPQSCRSGSSRADTA
ncbi:MAG: hypothetical protein ACKOEX_11130 [Planctomycetia bacterium]